MCPPLADKFYLLDCHASLRLLAMTGVLASVSPADWRPCRILRFAWIHCERSYAIQLIMLRNTHVSPGDFVLAEFEFVSQTLCHCEPRMWRGNPVYFMLRVSAPDIPKLRPMGRSFVSRILWFFFIGYRRGTRHPSRQPIGHQLCIVCHQTLCLPDSFLQRDWLPDHPLSPVQPPQ